MGLSGIPALKRSAPAAAESASTQRLLASFGRRLSTLPVSKSISTDW